MKPPPPPKGLGLAQQRFVLASVFVTGAITLLLEIVGSRLISPYYGSSLYCWSALITVTLVALAAGYNWGGRAADRHPTLTFFSRLVSAAGLAVALLPTLRAPALESTRPLGVQLGALASATLLVAPALLLLGALGPIAIRLRSEGPQSAGRNAGDVYALSTLGSVLGAVLAGFVLIPNVALSRILYGSAILLLLLGAAGSWLSALRAPTLQLAGAAAALLVGFWPRVAPETNLLLTRESAYGQIKVLDFGQRRYLLVNGTTQSMAKLDDLTNTDSAYLHGMELAMLAAPRVRPRALVVGLGAGLLPSTLERFYGAVADTVEIDPDILAAARRYFGFSPRGEVFLEDGRWFLERSPRRYDAVFLDAFGGEGPPHQLFTVEAFRAARARLEPGGVLAVNFVSRLSRGRRPWTSAYRTLAAVFPEVRVFVAGDATEDLGNVVFFASDDRLPLNAELARRLRAPAREDGLKLLAREITPRGARELEQAELLTDDFAPMEFLLADTALLWRRYLHERIAPVLVY